MEIKLKDCEIDNIIDTTNDYASFGNTFGDDNHSSFTDFTFVLSNNKKVSLNSFEGTPYGSPIGIDQPSKFLLDFLELVTSNDINNMTFTELVAFIIENHTTREIVIEVEKNGVVKKGIYTKDTFLAFCFLKTQGNGYETNQDKNNRYLEYNPKENYLPYEQRIKFNEIVYVENDCVLDTDLKTFLEA